MAFPPAAGPHVSVPPTAPHPSVPPTAAPGRASRRPLPRLVDQMRILLWFQFFVTLVTFLGVLIGTMLITNTQLDATSDEYASTVHLEHQLAVLLLAMAGTLILQALSAGLLRFGWVVHFPLIVLAQLAVLAELGYTLWLGNFGALGAALLVLLGIWIMANLIRGEVRRYLTRPRSLR